MSRSRRPATSMRWAWCSTGSWPAGRPIGSNRGAPRRSSRPSASRRPNGPAGRSSAGPLKPAPVTSPAPVSISDPDPIPAEIAAARGTRPGRLGRVLAGDLDAIVLMAMRKEPERRYASAEQLADDLRRHLVGRPVLARGDAMVYRAVKFVRRHPAATAAAVAVMLAVVAVIVGTTWGLVRARRERERDLDLAEASSRQAPGRRSILQPRQRGSAAQPAVAAAAAQGTAPGRAAVLRGVPGGARRRPGPRRRGGEGAEPARPDHRGDRLARRGRRPVPAGDRALG